MNMPRLIQCIDQLAPERIARAKVAFTARRFNLRESVVLLDHDYHPQAGDLLLATIKKVGHHQSLELQDGRKAHLFVGDEVLVSYGNRYAPDQFEAVVPDTLDPCHLVAAGGVAARVLSKHSRMEDPSELTPIGVLADIHGRPLNLADFALKKLKTKPPLALTLAVVGSAMNAGKTTTAAYLIKGLTAAGLSVGAAKVTGTGAGGDVWFMGDAGANPVLDFTDAGFASTYRVPMEQVTEIVAILTSHLNGARVDVIVVEISDGVYQQETAGLLSSPGFAALVDGIIFAASDAMGAYAGMLCLEKHGLPILGLSGVLTSSPLAVREAQEATGLPVLTKRTLRDPAISSLLRERLASRQAICSVHLRAV